MTPSSFGLILIGVLLNALAQLLLKAGTNVLGVITPSSDNWLALTVAVSCEPRFLFGFLCYGVSVMIWIVALSRVPVSVAYPLLSIGYIVNAIAAHYLFGETVTATRWLGIVCIVVGVVLVTRSA